MSIFNYKNHSIAPPPGSIMQYYGLSDPDGWIICDGVTRTSTDGRYSDLAILLNAVQAVNTNTANLIVPPDLRSKFLYGSSAINTGIGITGGASTKTLSISEMPAHSHSGTTGDDTPDHSHAYPQFNMNINQGDENREGQGRNRYSGATSQTSGASTRHKHEFTTSSAGSGTPFNILPPFIQINHIMKY